MKEVTGQLKMLGSGSTMRGNVGSSFIKYNTIEIGDTILQKIVSSQSLNDYISRGLGQEVTLYLNKNMLIGVKLPDGKLYYWKRSFLLFVFAIIMSIAFLAFAVVIGGMAGNFIVPLLVAAALIFFITKPHIMQAVAYQPRLSALGGMGLRG